jgi:hypothetical protein
VTDVTKNPLQSVLQRLMAQHRTCKINKNKALQKHLLFENFFALTFFNISKKQKKKGKVHNAFFCTQEYILLSAKKYMQFALLFLRFYACAARG